MQQSITALRRMGYATAGVHHQKMWKQSTIGHTCLRRDSIIASFCLIWARRYSRLLDEGTVNDSSSEEAGDKGLDISGTDEVEEAKSRPFIWDTRSRERQEALWKNLLWGAPRLPTLHNTAMSPCLTPFTDVLILREVAFHLKRCKSACEHNRSSYELTLFGHDMSAETLTFSFLQCVHAPGLSKREGNQRSDRRKERWEEEAPVIVKARKGTPTSTRQ